ncbi:DUF4430 domain-containing protein [Oceanobacillus sp. FSL W8-0428]|uniref:Transcobalamin-like C-terminal domain-containing protein n=1 Tax=Oceanobacillus sojae TaxID=582851 RepID=A0A511ZD76_9BACI|nr:DUF4430 domain-containing protein [Oceanobacillus sojae]GEN85399.1 hypothetical protein OSO01_01380 [Oceanobacillus sojae]
MNRWLKFLGIMLISFVLLAACGNNGDENENSNTSVSTNESSGEEQELAEDEVRITITIDDGNQYVSEEIVQVEEGDILLNVLEDAFYVEEDNGFITSIERVSDDEDEGKYWMYYVDGESSPVGAGEYELNGGEEIIFDLQSIE